MKLNRNGKMIVSGVGLLMLGSALLFQNCSPAPVTTDEAASLSATAVPGNSSYRLPANFNETLNTGVTCSVTVNAPTIPVGGTLTYIINTTGTVNPGYNIFAYGSKNGVADASEIMADSFTSLVQSTVNPGTIGGNYVRYFQIRDSLGRALCQTNAVAYTLEGRICTLSTPYATLRSGNTLSLTTTYGTGTVAPVTGTIVRFRGFNNAVAITPFNYDGTNYSLYTRVMTTADVGNDYVRQIAVHNPDESIYCQTNYVRIRVIP